MPTKFAPTRTINFTLILLWVASLAVAAAGWIVMTRSIDSQAELYIAKSQDVHAALASQATTGLGTTLIGVGVLGLLVALAVHALKFVRSESHTASIFDGFGEVDPEGGFEDLGVEGESTIVHSTETPANSSASGEKATPPIV